MLALQPHVKSGRVKALAILSAQRSTTMPEVPTAAEAGVAGYSHLTWIGIVAPAGTPAAIVNRLNREIAAVLGLQEVRERIVATGAEPVGGSTADFAATLATEYDNMAKLAQRIKFELE